ncbi:hypothetical protein [Kitasatospora sp. NPDC048407]|uniref:hypothetical protein n=1 Tax=Kitasatospora sp. NPDC048407 TaxID=3364051 RepID=UPI003719D668
MASRIRGTGGPGPSGPAARLVHVLERPQTDPDEDTPRPLDDHLGVGGDIVLAQARKLVEQRHPGLETETRAVDGPRARGLLEQAADASLLAVGAKRGPVVEQVLSLPPIGVPLSSPAPGPVAVVRETADTAANAPRPLVVVGVDGSPGSLAVGALLGEAARARWFVVGSAGPRRLPGAAPRVGEPRSGRVRGVSTDRRPPRKGR